MIDLDALEAAARAATPGEWGHSSYPSGTEFIQFGERGPNQSYRGAHITYYDVVSLGLSERETRHGKWADAEYISLANPAIVLALIARLRAAEGALMAIHEFANDDGNWEHEEIIADDGMFIGCDGRYTVEAMASDALKGMSDAVPNV